MRTGKLPIKICMGGGRGRRKNKGGKDKKITLQSCFHYQYVQKGSAATVSSLALATAKIKARKLTTQVICFST
jgi:hypothetical protein